MIGKAKGFLVLFNWCFVDVPRNKKMRNMKFKVITEIKIPIFHSNAYSNLFNHNKKILLKWMMDVISIEVRMKPSKSRKLKAEIICFKSRSRGDWSSPLFSKKAARIGLREFKLDYLAWPRLGGCLRQHQR